MAGPEIEHRDPIIVGFFLLHFAKQRMLELCYIFAKKFSDADKYEELDMDTDSFPLAVSDEKLKIRRVEGDPFGRLHRHVHCNRNRHFPSHNVLQYTLETQ